MGFELNAFLGRTAELQKWKEHLASAVVCELGGELGMVPLTHMLFEELRARLGEEEAKRLDAASGYRIYPSPSHAEGVRRWGLQSSRGTAIAYVSLGEFGDRSHEDATLWSHQKQVLSNARLRAVLDHFRDQVSLELGAQQIDLSRYRGENAAEKWAAATTACNGK